MELSVTGSLFICMLISIERYARARNHTTEFSRDELRGVAVGDARIFILGEEEREAFSTTKKASD